MNGILCIDKPGGMTSFDVVAIVRRLSGEKKAGHGGTLDPMATGVLPLFLGNATRAVSLLPSERKSYTAVMKLGLTTDTGDVTGTVTGRSPVRAGAAEVNEALSHFTGEIMQTPPMYSAKKVGGKKLYELARQGVSVERAAVPVTIHSLRLLADGGQENEYTLGIVCSRGTYIRTLCEDIGALLGCGAVMAALRRTESAGFALGDCITLDTARELAGQGKLSDRLLPVEDLFGRYPAVTVTPRQAVRFGNGGPLFLARLQQAPAEGLCRVKDEEGRFLGLGEARGEMLLIKRLFAGGNGFADH